jgi:hypothetical protein
MLITYFDDSGTHDNSNVVLWLGIFGNEHQWAYFSDLWARKLHDPSPAKLPLSRFHMEECQKGNGEFLGWSRAATDFLVHELGQIITKAGLWSYCTAVSRNDWDGLVGGDWRRAWGDAEQHCIMGCFSSATLWAQDHGYGDIAFVFDDRPHRNAQVKKMFDIYRRGLTAKGISPSLDSITFATSVKFAPLQAADLLAWEQYQFTNDMLKRGSMARPRKQLARIMKDKRIFLRMVDKKEIERMLNSEYGNAERVAGIAKDMDIDFS